MKKAGIVLALLGGVTEDMIKVSSKQVADTNCD